MEKGHNYSIDIEAIEYEVCLSFFYSIEIFNEFNS